MRAMRPQPLICVTDVESSSRWYQRLLGVTSGHGGSQYEQLLCGGHIVLQLHSFEAEHHHGSLGNRADRPYGNGVLLWFEVEDFDAVLQHAGEMGVEIILPRHRNPPDGEGGPQPLGMLDARPGWLHRSGRQPLWNRRQRLAPRALMPSPNR
jgi:hypothetical protein